MKPRPAASGVGLAGLALAIAAGSLAPPSAPKTSAIEGSFGLLDPDPPQWWSCLRCADYRPSGGAWKLQFSSGTMTLTYQVTGWTSHASYRAQSETLELFDDPVCPSDRGRYRWRIEGHQLILQPLDDPCSFGLRAGNLSRIPWMSCGPPDLRAAASDAWNPPAGCPRLMAAVEPTAAPSDPRVSVVPGDIRLGGASPQVIPANTENATPPPGVSIHVAPRAVRYGLYVILWAGASWVEAAFPETAGPIGVQFLGPSSTGSARLLLDGEEVWRGDVSTLGEHHGQYGGYVEVAGLAPESHRLRVERLTVDTRPVRVMFFGRP